MTRGHEALTHVFPLSLHLQACNDSVCLPPERLTLWLTYPAGESP